MNKGQAFVITTLISGKCKVFLKQICCTFRYKYFSTHMKVSRKIWQTHFRKTKYESFFCPFSPPLSQTWTKVFRKYLCTINLITYDPLALSKAPGMSNDHLLRKRKQNHFWIRFGLFRPRFW